MRNNYDPWPIKPPHEQLMKSTVTGSHHLFRTADLLRYVDSGTRRVISPEPVSGGM